MQRNASTSFSAFSPLALNVRACAGIMDEREMLDAIQEELRGTCAGYAGPEKREA